MKYEKSKRQIRHIYSLLLKDSTGKLTRDDMIKYSRKVKIVGGA